MDSDTVMRARVRKNAGEEAGFYIHFSKCVLVNSLLVL